MRIIKEVFLKAATAQFPRAKEALDSWVDVVKLAQWTNPVQLKESFPDVDPVKVKSGKTVYVCDIRGNEFRLIIAVHFNRQCVFTLRFLTHAEYDRRKWKDEL